MLVNDLVCMTLIYVLFLKKEYVRLAFYVFLIELLLILPVYLYFKLTLEGDSEISSPLLSPIHRMVINPLLMIVLIAGLYYQQFILKKRT